MGGWCKTTLVFSFCPLVKLNNKIAYEGDGILLSKVRLLDGMNLSETGEFGDFNLGTLERYSPLSYSIAQHVHWNVGRHIGIETTNRLSLEQVSSMQGMTLYREIASECIRGHMKRKKVIEVPMGLVAARDSDFLLFPKCSSTIFSTSSPF